MLQLATKGRLHYTYLEETCCIKCDSMWRKQVDGRRMPKSLPGFFKINDHPPNRSKLGLLIPLNPGFNVEADRTQVVT